MCFLRRIRIAVETHPGSRIGLFRNTGDGRFVDRTFLIPAKFRVGMGMAGAIFGDYDDDGDADLILIGETVEADGTCLRIARVLRNDNGLLVG